MQNMHTINKYNILWQQSTGSILIAEAWGLQQKRWELTWSCHTRWEGWKWGRLTPGWSPQGSTPWGEEKGSYCFPQQNNNKRMGMSYIGHRDRHPVTTLPGSNPAPECAHYSHHQLLTQVCGWNMNQSSAWLSCYQVVYEKCLMLRHSHPPRAPPSVFWDLLLLL